MQKAINVFMRAHRKLSPSAAESKHQTRIDELLPISYSKKTVYMEMEIFFFQLSSAYVEQFSHFLRRLI